MKNLKIVKKLLIIIMSIVLVLTVSTLVYAADEDPFLELTATNTDTNETTSLDTNTDSGNSIFTDIQNTNTTNNSSLTTNNTTNLVTNTNNTVNRSVTNTDTLAKTGISDFNGIVALIVVLSAVSAIYSYKKVNDYNKL